MKYRVRTLASMAVLAGVVPALSIQLLRPFSELQATITSFSPFVDPLPIPQHIIVPPTQTDLTVQLTQFTAKIHRDFPGPVTFWGYNGTSPGPVIDVESKQKIRIHWKNELPTTHVFPAPTGMMAMGPVAGSSVVMDGPRTPPTSSNMFQMLFQSASNNLPDVRNITHLHGAVVLEPNPLDRHFNNDGWPDAWNVPGEEQVAEYPNQQDARTLFYHDHAVGETGRNVAAGLAGVYEIHDSLERSLNLPTGKYEIPLILQSVSLDADGNRSYTDRIDHEFFGNAVLVNGKLLPFLNVEPRKYRFRFVNAANSRTFGLSLVDQTNTSTAGPAFYQIGSDAGFLEHSVKLNDPNNSNSLQLFLAPAERADIIVDFSKYAGRSFIMTNTNAITDPDGEVPIRQVMLFTVGKTVSEIDKSSLPTKIRTIVKLNPANAVTTRRIDITQTDKPDGTTFFQIDKRNWLYPKTDAQGKDYWDYEIDQKPIAGTTEVWELVNSTILMHPFHLHLAQFQILDRRPFDVDKYNATGVVEYTDVATPADANEAGWKDVVRTNKREVTRIIMHFGPETGYYVYHCHILEHEDMDMMVPFQVLPGASTQRQ